MYTYVCIYIYIHEYITYIGCSKSEDLGVNQDFVNSGQGQAGVVFPEQLGLNPASTKIPLPAQCQNTLFQRRRSFPLRAVLWPPAPALQAVDSFLLVSTHPKPKCRAGYAAASAR